MNNKFPKENRVLLKSDFLRLKSGSSRFMSKYFIIYSISNSEVKTRMGLAISKKFGCAVKRNYIKRVLREIFRNTDYKQSGKDILVTVRPKLNNDIPFHYIKEDFLSLLRESLL